MNTIVFHEFKIGDVEDPEMAASQPMWEFMQTPQGRWITERCPDPRYSLRMDHAWYGYVVEIWGDLDDRSAVEYILRWQREESL